MKIITRKEAFEQGLKYYFTGQPCKRGHVSKRMVRTYNCVECNKEDARKDSRTHREKRRNKEREYRKSRPEIDMICRARHRANKKQVPFNITVNDVLIPTTCPILGIPLKVNEGKGKPNANSPSLDRICPELGYVPGNIAVISHKANTLKNESTVEELELILEWIKRQHGFRPN